MKLATLAFLLLLAYAHAVGNPDGLLARPLSMFRDGERIWLGYALFALLLVIGVIYTTAQVRGRRFGDVVVASLALFLLLVVAATPSWGEFHVICSIVLLALLFGYYALLLYWAKSFWLIAHLAVPVALALATGFQSYGIWQKAFVTYLVIAATVQHHFLARQTAADAPRSQTRRANATGGSKKRRKVFRLEPGPEWARRRPEDLARGESRSRP